MQIQENFSLKNYNTFGVEAKAKLFAEFTTIEELIDLLLEFSNDKKLILGEGSNILLTQDFEGAVMKNGIKGIEKTQESKTEVSLRVGAGVNWHEFVMYCLSKDYAGIENLSLIPGTVGAAPMQNIGAYGVEVQEVIESVEAYAIKNGQYDVFSNAECRFAYRESIFKNRVKNQYVITHVNFKLSKKPNFRLEYGDIQKTLAEMGVQAPSIQLVSQAICQIRMSKLPNPAEIGNAGSFFKNPEIPSQDLEEIRLDYPDIVAYDTDEEMVKVPAAWLIERAGWKGKRIGDAGVHEKQALVLVNYGKAKGQEIKDLAKEIQESVFEEFGIYLKMEVNVY